MDLTPRDIQQKQFHDSFRGYAHEEVDLFLDEVAAAFDRVFRENQTMLHKVKGLEEELTKARGSEDMLKRMLVTAQETADKAVQEAKAKATEMVAGSEEKAAAIVSDAQARAQQIVTEATSKAEQIVMGAISKERQLQVSIEGMKRFDGEYRARLRAFMEAQLEQLAQGPELPDEPVPVEGGQPAAAEAQPPPVPPAARPVPADEGPRNGFIAPPEAGSEGVGDEAPPHTDPGVPAAQQTVLQEPAVVTVPEARPQGDQDDQTEATEHSIKKLFWGDD